MLELTKKQVIAIDYLTNYETDYIGYGGAAGGAKTYLGCYWLMTLGYYLPGAKFFIGRDSIKDTRASVLKTWSEVAAKTGFTAYKFNDVGIIFTNGTEIELLDLTFYPYKDPMFERLGSKEYTSGWIEEASQVHYLAFEVLKTRVGRWKNEVVKSKILCTFNPKKNWVDSFFYRPFAQDKEKSGVKFIYALPTDNPFLPVDYIKRLNDLTDNATKQRLLYGNFDYDDDDNALISYEKIIDCFDDHGQKGGLKYTVCDAAAEGKDPAIIMNFDGWRVNSISKINKCKIYPCAASSNPEQLPILIDEIKKERLKNTTSPSNIIIDGDGLGSGIADSLGGKNFRANKTNNFIKKNNYNSLKDACGYELAKIINNGELYIHCTDELIKKEIIEELQQLKRYKVDSDGKKRLLPKEEIKKNISRSPNYLDVLIMRMMAVCVGDLV